MNKWILTGNCVNLWLFIQASLVMNAVCRLKEQITKN